MPAPASPCPCGDFAGEHRGGVVGEVRRPVPGVSADDDARLRGPLDGEEPGGEARGDPPDDRAVHPRRTGAERPADAGGAEGQRRTDPLREPLVIAGVEEPLELGSRGGVRVVGDPVAGGGVQRGGVHAGGG
jgi:hypothetical protein